MPAFLNQGGLWDNQRKYEPHDPDFVGSINIGGVEHKLVGWMSTSTNKQAPTINLKVNNPRPVPMKYGQAEYIAASPEVAIKPKTKEKEDDIPF